MNQEERQKGTENVACASDTEDNRVYPRRATKRNEEEICPGICPLLPWLPVPMSFCADTTAWSRIVSVRKRKRPTPLWWRGWRI